MRLRSLIRLAGPAVLLLLLHQMEWERILATAQLLDPLPIAIAGVLLIPQLSIKAVRWRFLLRLQGCEVSIFDAHMMYFSSLPYGIATPGRSGELIKALYLQRLEVCKVGFGLSSVIIDRLLDLQALLIIASLGIPALVAGPEGVVVSVIALVTVILGGWFFRSPRTPTLPMAKNAWQAITGRILQNASAMDAGGFFTGVRKLQTPRTTAALAFTVAAYAIYCVQCLLLARACGISIQAAAVIGAVALSSLASLLPVSILGLGTRELTLLQLIGPLGTPPEQIVLYGGAEVVTFYLGTMVIGIGTWPLRWLVNRHSVQAEPTIHRAIPAGDTTGALEEETRHGG
jgi:glycosyltransferase 2 family protein